MVPGFCPGTRPRLVVPKAVQEKVMAEMHSGPFGGQFAACGTYEKLTRRYYWRGMYADVYRHLTGASHVPHTEVEEGTTASDQG